MSATPGLRCPTRSCRQQWPDGGGFLEEAVTAQCALVEGPRDDVRGGGPLGSRHRVGQRLSALPKLSESCNYCRVRLPPVMTMWVMPGPLYIAFSSFCPIPRVRKADEVKPSSVPVKSPVTLG